MPPSVPGRPLGTSERLQLLYTFDPAFLSLRRLCGIIEGFNGDKRILLVDDVEPTARLTAGP